MKPFLFYYSFGRRLLFITPCVKLCVNVTPCSCSASLPTKSNFYRYSIHTVSTSYTYNVCILHEYIYMSVFSRVMQYFCLIDVFCVSRWQLLKIAISVSILDICGSDQLTAVRIISFVWFQGVGMLGMRTACWSIHELTVLSIKDGHCTHDWSHKIRLINHCNSYTPIHTCIKKPHLFPSFFNYKKYFIWIYVNDQNNLCWWRSILWIRLSVKITN